MPHQEYTNGMQGYNSNQLNNQLSPTPQQVGALVPVSRGDLAAGDFGPLMPSSGPVHRIEERRLSREAMQRYLKDRNDMVLVILHAKVSICFHYLYPRGNISLLILSKEK